MLLRKSNAAWGRTLAKLGADARAGRRGKPAPIDIPGEGQQEGQTALQRRGVDAGAVVVGGMESPREEHPGLTRHHGGRRDAVGEKRARIGDAAEARDREVAAQRSPVHRRQALHERGVGAKLRSANCSLPSTV